MTAKVRFLLWPCLLITIATYVSAAFQCPSQRGSYNVADPDAKTGYYSCVNGVATLQSCATGTYFSPDSGGCVAVPSASGVNCNDGGFFQKPNPYDCTKFYKCDHGVAVPFDCPSGTYYNPALNVCDWPDKAGCVAKQRPASAVNPTNNNNNNQYSGNSNNDNNNNGQQNQKPDTTNNNNNKNNTNVEPIICPVYIQPGKIRLEPNPYDEIGQTYYLCDSRGGVYLRFCEEGTRFNTGLGRCNAGKVAGNGGDQQQQQQDQSYHW